MKKYEILDLKNKGFGNDAIYQLAAGNMGLFGVAFFGHKGNKGDKQKLNTCWKRIINP